MFNLTFAIDLPPCYSVHWFKFFQFKVTPWNVDTISQPGFTKTVVNKPAARQKNELSEEEQEKKFKSFIKENESLLKQFGMLRKYEDSKRFLMDHSQLACEDTANYLVYWCINLEMEEVCEKFYFVLLRVDLIFLILVIISIFFVTRNTI